jgi:hypothetical protein
LSKSATVAFWYISVVATFAFGSVFLFGWLSEEFATSDKWKARKKWLIIVAIVGVAGEQLATLGEFIFSEHLQTTDDAQIVQLTATVSGTFTAEELSILLPCLKNAPKGLVYVVPKSFDDRSAQYANRVRSIFATAGFNAKDQPSNTSAILGWGMPGIFLFVRDTSALPQHAVPILQCFNDKAKVTLLIGKFSNAIDWLGPDDVMIGVSAP